MVKHSGTKIEIATIKGPIQLPVTVGGITIKPELLQATGQILEILDWLQYSGCLRIQSLKKLKDIDSKTITDLILKQEEHAQMIASLAVVCIVASNTSSPNFEKVLSDWVAAAFPKANEILAKSTFNTSGKAPATLFPQEQELERIRSEKTAYESESIKNELKCRTRISTRKFGSQSSLDLLVSEAITATPYLSEAMNKKKPFNLKKSLNTLRKIDEQC